MIHKNNIHEDFPARTEADSRNLNLYNFECEEAIYSSYILTSPRSLKACRLANVKPIELLHRSIEEIAADLNLDTRQVNHIYFDYEQERLKKLEICKLIRKHILTSELVQRAESVSPTRFTNVHHTSKLTQPSRDCTPDLQPTTHEQTNMINSYSVPTTPLTQYNSLKRQRNKLLSIGLSSSNSAISLSSDSENFNYQKRSKSAEDKKYRPIDEKKTSKKYTLSAKKAKNCKKNLNKLPVKATTPINDRELCWEIDKTKKAENDIINKQIQAKDRSKKKLKEKKKSSENQELVGNKFIKHCENLVQTTSGAGKRQAKDSQSKILPRKRNQDSQSNSKQVQKKSVAKNRRAETEEIPRNTKVDFNVSNESGMGIKSHDARILDAMVLKKERQETQDTFANKANIIWRMAEEEQIPNKNFFHHSSLRNLKSEICACNENFAMETYFQQIKDRIKQLKENCLYKELHSEHVRQLARELQIGMEQWQDQVLLLQWRALQRAQTNAKLLLENKRLKTQSENKERTLMHALRFRNIQQLDRIKKQIMKREIEEKDHRIERLKIKREQEISNCRAQAHYTAELREQLRDTLTPETFDKKVNDVLVKSKFINRLLTTSSLGESKIRLG